MARVGQLEQQLKRNNLVILLAVAVLAVACKSQPERDGESSTQVPESSGNAFPLSDAARRPRSGGCAPGSAASAR
jgi:hypothetical protein